MRALNSQQDFQSDFNHNLVEVEPLDVCSTTKFNDVIKSIYGRLLGFELHS